MATYTKQESFKGNVQIRKGGYGVEYHPDQIAEYAKCAEDPIYFIENYVWIKNVDFEDLVLFKLRGYQLEMVEKMISNREYICKIPRQAGKSVCVSAVLLWYLIFNKNFSILIAAHKAQKANDVLAVIKQMYELLPPWLQAGVIEWNKGNIILDTNSRIRAAATSISSARGDTYNLVYIDEAGFIMPHIAEEFFKSVIPTISSGKTTKIFVTSTPRGLNHFYNMWRAAVTGQSGYAWTEIKWSDVPGRDDEFKQKVVSQYGIDYWRQEYEAEFIGSSRTLISANKLMALFSEQPKKIVGDVRLFEEPIKEKSYVITVDVAEGLGGDCTVIMVFDVASTPYKIAAIYQSREIDPYTLPGIIRDIGRSYNDAFVLIETNFGQIVADVLLQDFEYENVIVTQTKASKLKQLAGGWSTPKTRVGLKMDQIAKRNGCAALKTLIENDVLLVQDDATIEELRRFAVKGKSYAAEEGHDDLVMALVMFGWLSDQPYFRDLTNTSARSVVAKRNAQAIQDTVAPVGLRWDGEAVMDGMYMAVKGDLLDYALPDNDPEPDYDIMERINRIYPD